MAETVLLNRASRVEILLSTCRPSDIADFVVPVVVDAVNGVRPTWLQANFGEECVKRVKQDTNPTRPVVVVAHVFGIRASCAHGHPRAVFGRLPAAGHMPVFTTRGQSNLKIQTPARSGITVAHRPGLSDNGATASTPAGNQSGSCSASWMNLRNRQSSIDLTGSNYKRFRHVANYNTESDN